MHRRDGLLPPGSITTSGIYQAARAIQITSIPSLAHLICKSAYSASCGGINVLARNEVIALDLSASFSTSAAAWQTVQADDAPSVAWHTVNVLSNAANGSTAIQFGGDETDIALPTGADSAYMLSIPLALSTGSMTFKQEEAGWASEPIRRIRHASASLTTEDNTHLFVHGGLRNDFSGMGFAELWVFTACTNPASATCSALESPVWTQITADGGPPPLFGHTATLLQLDGQYVLVLIGGIDATVSQTTLAPITTSYLFTFSSDLQSGTWTMVSATGSAPRSRHGHIAVALNSTTILIHGGASGESSSMYGDLAILTLESATSASWSSVSSSGTAPPARAFHSGVLVDGQLVLGFGKSLQMLCSLLTRVRIRRSNKRRGHIHLQS